MTVRRAAPAALLPFLVLALGTACGSGGGGQGESSPGAGGGDRVGSELPVWVLDSAPRLVIRNDPSSGLELTRVAGAVRLANGRLLVAEAATHEVRTFDPSGRLVETIGRTGDGPGEFRSLAIIGQVGDTILIADRRLRRVTHVVTSPALAVGTMVSLTATSDRGQVDPLARTSRGEWLVRTGVVAGSRPVPGVHRDTSSFGLIRADGGGAVRWLAAVPGATDFVHPVSGGQSFIVGLTPFSSFPVGTVVADRIWLGGGDLPELMVFAADGAELPVVRFPLASRPLTDEMVARSLRHRLGMEGPPAGAEFSRAVHAPGVVPDHLPAIAHLLVSSNGDVWIGEAQVLPDDARRWLVVSREGVPLARIETPQGLFLLAAGPDWVLGVHYDDDGLPEVRLQRINR